MSTVILDKEQSVEVLCGDHLFLLWQGDDGNLHLEAADSRSLEVAISNDGDSQVTARGVYVNIDILSPMESD